MEQADLVIVGGGAAGPDGGVRRCAHPEKARRGARARGQPEARAQAARDRKRALQPDESRGGRPHITTATCRRRSRSSRLTRPTRCAAFPRSGARHKAGRRGARLPAQRAGGGRACGAARLRRSVRRVLPDRRAGHRDPEDKARLPAQRRGGRYSRSRRLHSGLRRRGLAEALVRRRLCARKIARPHGDAALPGADAAHLRGENGQIDRGRALCRPRGAARGRKGNPCRKRRRAVYGYRPLRHLHFRPFDLRRGILRVRLHRRPIVQGALRRARLPAGMGRFRR